MKFFRNIRKRLLAENRFVRYLIYALGEIVLVVLGILIALAVNNWNASQKEAALELQLLKGLDKDMNLNIQKLKELIEMDSFLVMGNQYLLEVIRDPESSYDSELDELFGSINRYSVFYPQRLTYESLKSRGLEIIKNVDLRSAIINLYDYEYMSNSSVEMELKRGLYESTNTVFLKHLYTGEEVYLKSPVDFDALKRDQEFINHLAHITAEQKSLSYFSKEHLMHTLWVKEDLEEEIGRLEMR